MFAEGCDHEVQTERGGGRPYRVPGGPTTGGETIQLPEATELPTTVELPNGQTYEAPSSVGNGHDRRFGQEQIYRLPGLNDKDDVTEVLRAPDAVEEDGEYTQVIGDNPNGAGQIALRLLAGVVVSASEVIRDPQDRAIELPEDANQHILNKDEWGHNQIGENEQEVRETVRDIVNAPDEIYKNPDQNRFMYVKKLELNGKTLIALVFVVNGVVFTAFVPTKKLEYPGYTNQNAIDYILDQKGMYKIYEENKITPPDIGEEIT